jgi:hypothetical protein
VDRVIRLAAALYAALRRHRPSLPQRQAAATARTGHWPITDTQLNTAVAQWANDMRQEDGK